MVAIYGPCEQYQIKTDRQAEPESCAATGGEEGKNRVVHQRAEDTLHRRHTKNDARKRGCI
jgi:hypothetical protein